MRKGTLEASVKRGEYVKRRKKAYAKTKVHLMNRRTKAIAKYKKDFFNPPVKKGISKKESVGSKVKGFFKKTHEKIKLLGHTEKRSAA